MQMSLLLMLVDFIQIVEPLKSCVHEPQGLHRMDLAGFSTEPWSRGQCKACMC